MSPRISRRSNSQKESNTTQQESGCTKACSDRAVNKVERESNDRTHKRLLNGNQVGLKEKYTKEDKPPKKKRTI